MTATKALHREALKNQTRRESNSETHPSSDTQNTGIGIEVCECEARLETSLHTSRDKTLITEPNKTELSIIVTQYLSTFQEAHKASTITHSKARINLRTR